MMTLIEALAADMPFDEVWDRREWHRNVWHRNENREPLTGSIICVGRWDGEIVQFTSVTNHYVAHHPQSWLVIKRELEQNVLDSVTNNQV